MLNYDELIKKAKEHGFTEAGPLDVDTLEFLPEVRDMCASGAARSTARTGPARRPAARWTRCAKRSEV